ncbi:hypothetical protein D3H55_07095 [Bacillus salacetis]|uniref:GAPS4 PD-(D/E)XK nuclease domain-containing protein n=1 Tax=Bacillus salacetis TaxID=2315464 RepID=A0A3A1R184_9BACI|nr:hypothetical protein [Bacillus salacetis]RIW35643.1 hypothetical protein D3H55_07095 [Bacillus salacetis]
MSEQQQFEGEKWTTQTIKILRELGWTQEGTSNFDIKCSFKTAHGSNEAKERKNDHGVDSLFSYFDPFLQQELNVLVESKKRVWSGISKSTISSFINQLRTTIECANVSEKLHELGVNGVDTGLLMVWCNEVEKYDYEKIKEYLSEIEIPSKTKPITIYVATNHEILKWTSLIEYKKKLESESKEFNFFFPSDYYRKFKSMSIQKNYVNLVQLYSSYIFGKSTREVRHSNGSFIQNVNHIFFYAEPTKKELEFMYQLVSEFQIEDADELQIHMYGDQSQSREHIDAFIRERKEIIKRNNSNLEIKVDYMDEF